jgi:hypothetical protein
MDASQERELKQQEQAIKDGLTAAGLAKQLAEQKAAFRRRMGRFSIPFKEFERDIFEIQRMLTQIAFVPTDVSTNYSSQEIWFVGLSNRFEELAEGSKIPIYKVGTKKHSVDFPAETYVVMMEDSEVKLYFRSPTGKPKATPKVQPPDEKPKPKDDGGFLKFDPSKMYLPELNHKTFKIPHLQKFEKSNQKNFFLPHCKE